MPSSHCGAVTDHRCWRARQLVVGIGVYVDLLAFGLAPDAKALDVWRPAALGSRDDLIERLEHLVLQAGLSGDGRARSGRLHPVLEGGPDLAAIPGLRRQFVEQVADPNRQFF